MPATEWGPLKMRMHVAGYQACQEAGPCPGKVTDPTLTSLTVTGHSGRSYLHGVSVFSLADHVSRGWELFSVAFFFYLSFINKICLPVMVCT